MGEIVSIRLEMPTKIRTRPAQKGTSGSSYDDEEEYFLDLRGDGKGGVPPTGDALKVISNQGSRNVNGHLAPVVLTCVSPEYDRSGRRSTPRGTGVGCVGKLAG